MRKQEASVTPSVNKWFSLVVKTSSPWDVKHTRGSKRFSFSEIKEHQFDWLMAATTENGCTWKIPDLGIAFPPFDTLHYKNTSAYLCIYFPQKTYAIEIRVIDKLIQEGKKSITEEEAFLNCEYLIENKKLSLL